MVVSKIAEIEIKKTTYINAVICPFMYIHTV